MLDINLDVDAGTRYEAADKAGLASLTVGMLDKGVAAVGSTPARDEAAIADAFADVGASLSGGAGGDRTSLRLRTLSDPAERQPAVDLMAQIAAAPTVPDAVLARDKQRTVAAIRESLTKPQVLADRAFGTAIYGTHPYGQSATPETIEGITRDDILRFYHANYTAKRAVVTLIGAISRQEAEAIAEQVTRGLPPDGATPPALPAVNAPLAKAETVRIPHPAQQATIVMGQPGIARSDKDYFPLLVGNYVLGGGGFSSRLTNEVREKRGLTYSIGSYFAPAAQLGPFELALQTRKDQAEQALTVVRDTLARFVADGRPTRSSRPPRTTSSTVSRCAWTATASCWTTSPTSRGTTFRSTTWIPGRSASRRSRASRCAPPSSACCSHRPWRPSWWAVRRRTERRVFPIE